MGQNLACDIDYQKENADKPLNPSEFNSVLRS